VVCLLLILAVGVILYRRMVTHVRENGLLSYLPEKLQKNLSERRLFDLLCDFWYLPQ
jgi:hypothetical protein